MRNLLCSLTVFFLFIEPSFCQFYEINWKKIETINNHLFSNKNQVLKLKYSTKNRYKSQWSSNSVLVNFECLSKGTQNLYFMDSFSLLNYKVDKNYYYYRLSDSLDYKKRELKTPFDIKRNMIPNELFFLRDLPISFTSFYKNKVKTNNILYQTATKDTTILEQYLKQNNIVRTIFLNKNLEIFKIAFRNLDSNNNLEKWQIDLTVFKNSNLIQIADSLNFGPYRDYVPIININQKKEIKTYINGKLDIPLVNNLVLHFDSTQIKYYVFDLWYIGCKPCYLLKPYLEDINNKIDTSKIILLGHNLADAKNDIEGYCIKKSYKIPEIDHTAFYLDLFKTDEYPVLLIVNSNFELVEKFVGYSAYNILKLKHFLKENDLYK